MPSVGASISVAACRGHPCVLRRGPSYGGRLSTQHVGESRCLILIPVAFCGSDGDDHTAAIQATTLFAAMASVTSLGGHLLRQAKRPWVPVAVEARSQLDSLRAWWWGEQRLRSSRSRHSRWHLDTGRKPAASNTVWASSARKVAMRAQSGSDWTLVRRHQRKDVNLGGTAAPKLSFSHWGRRALRSQDSGHRDLRLDGTDTVNTTFAAMASAVSVVRCPCRDRQRGLGIRSRRRPAGSQQYSLKLPWRGQQRPGSPRRHHLRRYGP